MNSSFISRRRQVLVVDDEYINRQMLGFILSTEYEVLYAENGEEALEILRDKGKEISLVMLDLLMPKMDGFEFLKIRQKDEDLQEIPVVVLTSEKEAELKSLKLGASDFIKKPYDMPEVILARVENVVELFEDRHVIRGTEREKLTGLYSMQFFCEYVQQREDYFPNRMMDVGALNIEKFHLVNEIFGREFGNRVLCTVADILQGFLMENGGIACRGEADWFYIYVDHQKDYEAVLSQLQNEMDQRVTEMHIRLRLGMYIDQDHEMGIEQRCDQAKIACDTLRNDYTKTVAFYDVKMHEDSLMSLRLINEVQQAIQEKQLQVYYQPKYAIQGDQPVLCSAEALVRWAHPELGMISPGVFIPLFEKNGLIQQVDYHVWREAGAQVKAWKEQFGVTVPVSVNVSRIDLYDSMIEEKLDGILKEFDLSTEDYFLEVTESAYVEQSSDVEKAVRRLRDKGFRIEMDDFGSGYSSLGMLATLPVDVLKIDMGLIRNIHKNEKNLLLVKAILDIAHLMSFETVAEGVEEEAQCELLKNAGCDVIQGWYFSRPVPASEFEKFFKKEM